MSAHSASHRRSWLTALVAQIEEYVFETVEEEVEPVPARLEPYPVIGIVSASPKSGATTLARLLAAELAVRAEGAAVVASAAATRRGAPPSRAAVRLTTALSGAVDAQPCGRLCLTSTATTDVVNAARYLAPIVLDLPPDGSAADAIANADRVAVVAGATSEPALLDAVATVLGCDPVKVVNRVGDTGAWRDRADLLVSESKLGARSAAMGTRALGALGSAIADLADSLELPR